MAGSNDNIEALVGRQVPARVRHRHRERYGAARTGRGRHSPHLREEGRAAVHARLAAEGIPPVAAHEGAGLGARALPADRLPGHLLLLRAEVPHRRPEEPRGRGPEAAGDLRQAGHPAARARAARRRGGGCGVRQRLGRHHLQGAARRGRRHLLSVLRGGQEPPGTGRALSRHGRAGARQLLRRAQLCRVHRRLVRVRAEGRALPDGAVHLLPHQRRSTPGSSSAR